MHKHEGPPPRTHLHTHPLDAHATHTQGMYFTRTHTSVVLFNLQSLPATMEPFSFPAARGALFPLVEQVRSGLWGSLNVKLGNLFGHITNPGTQPAHAPFSTMTGDNEGYVICPGKTIPQGNNSQTSHNSSKSLDSAVRKSSAGRVRSLWQKEGVFPGRTEAQRPKSTLLPVHSRNGTGANGASPE